MDVRQLRQFVAVADTLHFGRAAERLGMTQPPLSQSILALERELGATLFARTKRSVALTAFGEQWLEEVRRGLERLDALPEIAARLRTGMAGHLALSFVSTADYHVLPALVREFTTRFPDVDLRLSEATSDLQIPALLERRTHAGIIIPPAAGLPPELGCLPLVSEPLVVAVPESWIGQGRMEAVGDRLTAQAIADLPLILFPKAAAPAFHDLVTGYFALKGGSARIGQQAIQMQTIISLVSAGLGIALVPASLRKMAREGVSYLDLEDAPFLATSLVWREDDHTPTLRHFIEIARGAAELPSAIDAGWLAGNGPRNPRTDRG